MNVRFKPRELTLLGLMTALLLVMSCTPLGYLHLGTTDITLNMIPVAITAAALGPVGGAITGTVFGITSFLQCLGIGGSSPMGVAMLAINPLFTVITCIVPRVLAGLLTGIFHTFMGIPAILAGILTQLILWSVNLKIMGLALDKASAANLPLSSRTFNTLVTMLDMNKSLIVLEVICIVLVAALYWFFGTEYGASLRATGANAQMSRAQGINTSAAKIFGLVLSNGIVAFSGALLAQYQGNADINMGRGAIVIGLAAVIIGEALFGWIARNNFALKLITVLLGGITYFFVYSTVIYLGLDSNYLKMLSAVVVAIFLAVPYWKKTYFSKPHHKKKSAAKEDIPHA